ncbi:MULTISPECIES: hypothetical protein [Tsukamurella]|uniref:MarR family transcriptional regulator n=1 Tax=Tsukamurella spumae TaxID=44753 RepID=A0A846WZ62_9ACTN|nr:MULTISPECIES: hypothetical protein [Tsukamurella]NKY18161.1 hypothetical protein [Tsukamurella spumae]UEA84016.1 hypothetical protein LK411_04040 [Tsukamurella paurometabola]
MAGSTPLPASDRAGSAVRAGETGSREWLAATMSAFTDDELRRAGELFRSLTRRAGAVGG